MVNKKEEFIKKINENGQKIKFKEVIEFIRENIEEFDLENKEEFALCHGVAKHLFKFKIGEFDKSDANFLVNYLAKLNVSFLRKNEHSLGQVNIKVLNQEEYEKVSKDSRAVCIDNEDNTFDVVYSEKVSEDLMSRNPNTILCGLQTICHEITHVLQNTIIHNKDICSYNNVNNIQEGYKMALETITRRIVPDFYKKNYDYLLKENNANANGLKWAMQILKIYSPELYNVFDQEKVQKKIDGYKEKVYGGSIKFPNFELEKGKITRTMEFLVKNALEKDPQMFLDKYPVLNVAYDKEGKRKSISELLSYREEKINNNIEEESVNSLILTILNSRSMSDNELKCEIDELEDCIFSKPQTDEFVYELLKKRYVDWGVPEEKVKEHIALIRNYKKEFGNNESVSEIGNKEKTNEDVYGETR